MEVTKEKMIEVLENAKSMREVILYFGLSSNGSGGYRNIKNKILSLGLEIPKYVYRGDGPKKNKLSDETVFCENSTYSRHRLKGRIIQNKKIDYVCCLCGNDGFCFYFFPRTSITFMCNTKIFFSWVFVMKF